MCCCSFSPERQRNTIEAEQLAANTLAHSELYYIAYAQQLADIQLGANVALQNPQTKL